MSNMILDNGDSVARYCKYSALDRGGMPTAAAFKLRCEEYLSANWLEFFEKSMPDDAVEEIRKAVQSKGFHLRPKAKFFVLAVGEINAAGGKAGADLRVERRPCPDDESHADIFGYAASDVAVELELVLAAASIGLSYPACSTTNPADG